MAKGALKGRVGARGRGGRGWAAGWQGDDYEQYKIYPQGFEDMFDDWVGNIKVNEVSRSLDVHCRYCGAKINRKWYQIPFVVAQCLYFL